MEIRSLKDKKSIRLEDVDTKFLKFSTNLIAPILSNIFNICAKTGEFPDSLKIAEVIPVFKKGDSLKATSSSTDPFPYYLNLIKFLKNLLCSRIYNCLENTIS